MSEILKCNMRYFIRNDNVLIKPYWLLGLGLTAINLKLCMQVVDTYIAIVVDTYIAIDF